MMLLSNGFSELTASCRAQISRYVFIVDGQPIVTQHCPRRRLGQTVSNLALHCVEPRGGTEEYGILHLLRDQITIGLKKCSIAGIEFVDREI